MSTFVKSLTVANGLIYSGSHSTVALADQTDLSASSLLMGSSSTLHAVSEISLGSGLSIAGSVLSFTGDTTLPGTVICGPWIRSPTGYLLCDGSAVSSATYPALFAAMVDYSAVTITHATPCVVSWTGYNLADATPVYFTTTGTLPAPLVVGTTYYLFSAGGGSSFWLAPTAADASIIATTTAGSGTHTCYAGISSYPFAPTDFVLPNLMGRTVIGAGLASPLTARGLGDIGGEENHQLVTAEMPAHTHTYSRWTATATYTGTGGSNIGPANSIQTSSSTGGNGSHNTMMPFVALSYYIKT